MVLARDFFANCSYYPIDNCNINITCQTPPQTPQQTPPQTFPQTVPQTVVKNVPLLYAPDGDEPTESSTPAGQAVDGQPDTETSGVSYVELAGDTSLPAADQSVRDALARRAKKTHGRELINGGTVARKTEFSRETALIKNERAAVVGGVTVEDTPPFGPPLIADARDCPEAFRLVPPVFRKPERLVKELLLMTM